MDMNIDKRISEYEFDRRGSHKWSLVAITRDSEYATRIPYDRLNVWQNWINEHISGEWYYPEMGKVLFSEEEDAVLFQLAWG